MQATQQNGRATLLVFDADHPENRTTLATTNRSEGDLFLFPVYWTDSGRIVYHDSRNAYFAVDRDGQGPLKLLDRAMLGAEAGGEHTAPLLRTARFIAPCPDDHDAVMIESFGPTSSAAAGVDGAGMTRSVLFKVNCFTGERVTVRAVEREGRLVYDWMGRPRLVQLEPLHTAERDFALVAPTEKQRDTSLDTLLGTKLPLKFRCAPENYFGPRSIPLGFGTDPEILYYASNIGRDTFGLYAFDLRTKQRTEFAVEDPARDLFWPSRKVFGNPIPIFDRHRRQIVGLRLPVTTHWLDPELARAQTSLEEILPRRRVLLQEWNAQRTRFLFSTVSLDTPGRYYLYNTDTAQLLQLGRMKPDLDLDTLHPTQPWTFVTPDGTTLHGCLTQPQHPLINPPPLLVMLHDAPWRTSMCDFYSPDAQVLASMGFLVLQLDYRGTSGHGLRHLMAMREGIDPIPLEDLRATLAWLAPRHPYDKRRVALLGHGFGGFLALRALQLFPKEFRCAIAIDAPTDLAAAYAQTYHGLENGARAMDPLIKPQDDPTEPEGPDGLHSQFQTRAMRSMPQASEAKLPRVDFQRSIRRQFYGSAGPLRAISPLRHPETLQKPVFLIHETHDPIVAVEQAKELRDALVRAGRSPEYMELGESFLYGRPEMRARVFARIGEFLNMHVYDYKVDVGEVIEQK